MITLSMQEAINEQINAELWSAYLYLSMSMAAENKELPGIAHWFFRQWQEEQEHARRLQQYVNARGGRVLLEPIDGVEQDWDSPLEMFRDTLRHEQEVTQMINSLTSKAIAERDYATVSLMKWFVDEQVEEEQTAAAIVVQLERARVSASLLDQIDRELGERE